MNKRGYKVGDLLSVGLILVVATIGIAIGADVIDEVQDGQTADSYADNVSDSGLEAMDELGGWLPTIALVVAASIIIGTLIYSFAFRR